MTARKKTANFDVGTKVRHASENWDGEVLGATSKGPDYVCVHLDGGALGSYPKADLVELGGNGIDAGSDPKKLCRYEVVIVARHTVFVEAESKHEAGRIAPWKIDPGAKTKFEAESVKLIRESKKTK